MATGKMHQLATVALAPAAAGVGYVVSNDVWIAGAVTAGVLFGLLVHPDRDLRVSKIDFDMAGYTLGLGLIWPMLWYPYSSAIPRHRHPLSHLPAVGTAGRVAYMLFVVWLFTLISGYELPQLLNQWWVIPALGGLALSDTLHWLMDGMPLT